MNTVKAFLLTMVVVLIAGCANPYSQFYKGESDARLQPGYDPSARSLLIYSTDNFEKDKLSLIRRGYLPIGAASFNSSAGQVTESHLKEQATKIGAHAVLLSVKFSHTVSGAVPLTVPQNTTTFSTGNATAYGRAGSVSAYGNSVSTTYGTQTLMMPYTVERSDFSAIFFAKFKPRIGLYVGELDDSLRKQLQRNSGVVVLAVVDDSPAFRANIVPGDVLISIDDTEVVNISSYTSAMRSAEGNTANLRVVRNEKILEVKVPVTKLEDRSPKPNLEQGVPTAQLADSPELQGWIAKSTESALSGQWAEAIRTASAAISLAPKNVAARINRCWAYTERSFYDEALIDCSVALEVEPNNLEAKNNIALIKQKQGKIEESIEGYRVACLGGLEISCNNFKSIVGYSPKDVPQLIKLKLDESMSSFNKGEWLQVIELSSQVLLLDSKNEIAYINRSAARSNLGDIEGAFADASAAIAINPNEPLGYINRGFSLEKIGKRKEALLDYEISCGLKSNLGCDNYKKLRLQTGP